MDRKGRIITDKKQCPYCQSNNIHYLGYFAGIGKLSERNREKKDITYDFKCEDCKRIFYYRGAL